MAADTTSLTPRFVIDAERFELVKTWAERRRCSMSQIVRDLIDRERAREKRARPRRR